MYWPAFRGQNVEKGPLVDIFTRFWGRIHRLWAEIPGPHPFVPLEERTEARSPACGVSWPTSDTREYRAALRNEALRVPNRFFFFATAEIALIGFQGADYPSSGRGCGPYSSDPEHPPGGFVPGPSERHSHGRDAETGHGDFREPGEQDRQAVEPDVHEGDRRIRLHAEATRIMPLMSLARPREFEDSMADRDLVDRLLGGAESFNAWRRAFPDVRPDLTGADLTGADLRGCDLSRSDLAGAYLTVAELEGCDFSGSDLSGANLTGADATGAVLRAACLRGADLSFAVLNQADLGEADLSGARLTEAILHDADLRRCRLEGAVLRRAILVSANLAGADLTGADLTGAELEGATLPIGLGRALRADGPDGD